MRTCVRLPGRKGAALDRSELMRELEVRVFEVSTRERLSANERYAICGRLGQSNGCLAYRVIGSKGTDVQMSARQPLPDQPFLVIREVPDSNETAYTYKAISVPALEELLGRL